MPEVCAPEVSTDGDWPFSILFIESSTSNEPTCFGEILELGL
ncbi:unnamed protein product [Acidithrix sp. C25]|nr:unnamed protein product [Acidithrix sp. C25]